MCCKSRSHGKRKPLPRALPRKYPDTHKPVRHSVAKKTSHNDLDMFVTPIAFRPNSNADREEVCRVPYDGLLGEDLCRNINVSASLDHSLYCCYLAPLTMLPLGRHAAEPSAAERVGAQRASKTTGINVRSTGSRKESSFRSRTSSQEGQRRFGGVMASLSFKRRGCVSTSSIGWTVLRCVLVWTICEMLPFRDCVMSFQVRVVLHRGRSSNPSVFVIRSALL